jgi:putative two-component system response regulator
MNQLPSKQTILIVDDVLVNIKLLTGTLKSEYEICSATNGLDALEIAISDNPSDYTTEDYDTFALSSTLHDVGKIGIPDSILLKPGKLTSDEWEIMKSHTTIGTKLLVGSGSKFLNLAESITLAHHEKWDGTGYPNKVKGEKIPIEGRITCICDVFDALISKRPYKEAWPVEKAMDEISNGAGIHFDPGLVRLFLELEPELKMTIKELN